jgi:hypothetical protein
LLCGVGTLERGRWGAGERLLWSCGVVVVCCWDRGADRFLMLGFWSVVVVWCWGPGWGSMCRVVTPKAGLLPWVVFVVLCCDPGGGGSMCHVVTPKAGLLCRVVALGRGGCVVLGPWKGGSMCRVGALERG